MLMLTDKAVTLQVTPFYLAGSLNSDCFPLLSAIRSRFRAHVRIRFCFSALPVHSRVGVGLQHRERLHIVDVAVIADDTGEPNFPDLTQLICRSGGMTSEPLRSCYSRPAASSHINIDFPRNFAPDK